VSQCPRAHLVTLAIIPFLLLSSAQSTTVRTTVYLDGSIQREVTAEFLQARRANVLAQVKRALPEADRRLVTPVGEGLKAVWNVILSSASQIEGANLQYEDTVAHPLSLFTYYTWTETMQVPSETATAVEKAEPGKAILKYVVVMPGTVTEANAKPTKVEKPAPQAAAPSLAPAPAPTPRPAPAAPTAPAPAATSRPAPAAPTASAPAATSRPAPAAPTAPAPAATSRPAPAAPAAPAPAPTSRPAPTAPAPRVATPGPAPTAPAPAAAPAPAPLPPSPAPSRAPAPAAMPASEAPAPARMSSGPSLAPEKQGDTATFTLSGASEAYEITVTSRRVRWGYLVAILYILAFLAYRITAFALHRAKIRPQRI